MNAWTTKIFGRFLLCLCVVLVGVNSTTRPRAKAYNFSSLVSTVFFFLQRSLKITYILSSSNLRSALCSWPFKRATIEKCYAIAMTSNSFLLAREHRRGRGEYISPYSIGYTFVKGAWPIGFIHKSPLERLLFMSARNLKNLAHLQSDTFPDQQCVFALH